MLIDRLCSLQGIAPVLGLSALQREGRGCHLELIEVDTVQCVVVSQMHDQVIGEVRLSDDLKRSQSLLCYGLTDEQYIRQQKAMHITLADVVLEFVVTLHEQVTHLVSSTASHGSTQIEHLAMLLDQLFQAFVVGVLQAIEFISVRNK